MKKQEECSIYYLDVIELERGIFLECRQKRTFLNPFWISNCSNCPYRKEDETILIGNNSISIYSLFNDCINLEINKDDLYFNSKKLKRLLLDAVLFQERIFLIFCEDFQISKYYEVFEKVLETGLSIQIIRD